ncbi:MAG: DUF1501 domain-containing protein [Planctomycetota bacterium]|nr:DUF1501 domain-containing protein [Planctomycetota bacterium]MDA1139210.1 DUF1501 domain-containing protein [Planctomycetota bacterium]
MTDTAAGLTAASLSTTFANEQVAIPSGKAEHCIFIWLGGGVGQMDTFDPKRPGDPKKKEAGSYYEAVNTAIPGVKVCKHLSRCANVLDRFVILRTVHHDVIDEHAAAVNRMHTGRLTSGTIVYPSIGSIVSHEKANAKSNVPGYVLIGYPNLTRGPGFLGAKHTYLYLTDTESGPPALTRPKMSESRQQRRERLLAMLRTNYLEKHKGEKILTDYDAITEQAFRLASPQFMSVFDLAEEPGTLRESYGGEFGQRCLLARRLVQSGVSFIEVAHNLNFVNGTGWDVHNDGILNQYLLIEELDKALSTLVVDLEKHKLLEKTLIVVASEFGRPAKFDGGGGRGHHSKAFSVVLAGGGIKAGQVVGETDELAETPISHPISVPDLFATIFNALGINPAKNLKAGKRPVPITDMGKPAAPLFV